jgi:hypothetical protein
MKFRITEAVNKYDGNPIFHIYEWDATANRWSYKSGTPTESDARAYVDRFLHPKEERVIADIEGPTP